MVLQQFCFDPKASDTASGATWYRETQWFCNTCALIQRPLTDNRGVEELVQELGKPPPYNNKCLGGTQLDSLEQMSRWNNPGFRWKRLIFESKEKQRTNSTTTIREVGNPLKKHDSFTKNTNSESKEEDIIDGTKNAFQSQETKKNTIVSQKCWIFEVKPSFIFDNFSFVVWFPYKISLCWSWVFS